VVNYVVPPAPRAYGLFELTIRFDHVNGALGGVHDVLLYDAEVDNGEERRVQSGSTLVEYDAQRRTGQAKSDQQTQT